MGRPAGPVCSGSRVSGASSSETVDSRVALDDEELECREIRVAGATSTAPTLVFLHEGLGSVSMWRATPRAMCEALGCNGLAYSRLGYGTSTRLKAPRPMHFMEREADDVLPRLLEKFSIKAPVLLGHSDGASIALLYASRSSSLARGAIVLAPHVFVEDIALHAIRAAREAYLAGPLRERLKPHHADVDGAFFGWNDVWLDPDFASWDITARIAAIKCPVTAIQGVSDEYGTMAQLDAVLDKVPHCSIHVLSDCRHSPHRDQPAAVTALSQALLRNLAATA